MRVPATKGNARKRRGRRNPAPKVPAPAPAPAASAGAHEQDKRRRLEAVLLRALWRSEAHRRLAGANLLGVVCFDSALRLREANDHFLRMLGLPDRSAEAGALRWDALTAPTHREADAACLSHLWQRGTAGPWETVLCDAQGAPVPVLVGAATLDGADSHAVAFVLDLTERKRAEEQAASYAAELRRRNDALEEDLRMARELQTALLPDQLPRFVDAGGEPGLRFCHRYLPAAEVGGDFFDVLSVSEHRAGLLVCDVMGHGVRAALVTAMVRALVSHLMHVADDPGRLLTELNLGLLRALRPTGAPMFVTASYAVLDARTGLLRRATAGHPSGLVLRRSPAQVAVLKGAAVGPALGLFDDARYENEAAQLAPGDALLLYTDGLCEPDPDRPALAEEELAVELSRQSAAELSARLDGLVATLRERSGSKSFADDVCLLAVERL